jgi:hypothetical protein
MMINQPTTRRHLLVRVASFALPFLASANLYAQDANVISLNGSAEVPPVSTSANGNGQITVMPDLRVSGSIKTTGIIPTMAHIHEAAVGKNGPPIIALNQTADDSFAVPPDARLTEAQYSSYIAGKLYVNVHSAQFPNGEIRAQLAGTATAGTPTRPGY